MGEKKKSDKAWDSFFLSGELGADISEERACELVSTKLKEAIEDTVQARNLLNKALEKLNNL